MSQQCISYFENGKFTLLNNLPFKVKQISSSTDSVLILTTDFQVYLKGRIEGYNYDDFTKLENFNNIKYIASGEPFNLLIDNLNNVFICGELGDTKFNSFTKFDTIKDEIKFIASGADVVIVTKTNKLIICGLLQPFNGQEFTKEDGLSILENVPKNIEIKDLQIGYYHSILLDNLGNVYGSGENKNGQLGNTDETTLKEYTKLNIPFKVKKIATYTEGTLLLNYNNELFGSGENYNYQLGMTGRFDDFTKIVLNGNLIIKKLYHSEKNYNIILTNDGFYGCGNHKFGFCADDGFKKLEYKKKLEYLHCKPFLGFTFLYFIESDIKINSKKINEIKIYTKIVQQLLERKNADIIIKFSNE